MPKLEDLERRLRSALDEIALLKSHIKKQDEIIQMLLNRLSKNSSNSSKPPSTDGYAKPSPKSLRKSTKRYGGQEGHKGGTLKPVETPDHVVIQKVNCCDKCGLSLDTEQTLSYVKRQVFDIPQPLLQVLEYLAEVKSCPGCGEFVTAEFPEGVTGPVQYGPNIRTFAAYFNTRQFLPLERTCETIEDLFGHRVSEAMVIKSTQELAQSVKSANGAIKEQLLDAEVMNNDETGLRLNGGNYWLHVAATDKLTHYGSHKKRGKDATDEIGILPRFRGISVHDHWAPYYGYDCQHALCNAHQLRKLTFLHERRKQKWALGMIELLLEIKCAVDLAGAQGLGPPEVKEYEKRYDEIVREELKCKPLPKSGFKRDMNLEKRDTLNMVERLRDYKTEILRFMHNPRVPFDNNLAERDVRMMKVKQKISGCFRTVKGMEDFCEIRGYVSTARKNGIRAFEAIQRAFDGNPFVPQPYVGG
jgi:transposase